MSTTQEEIATEAAAHQSAGENTAFIVLLALSVSHLLNDIMQSLIPAVYPIFKENYSLSFTEVGLITLTFQSAASILQPVVGMAADHRPRPYSLALGMVFTLMGLLLLAVAGSFSLILLAVGLVGIGSAIFHPEASRLARLASGGQHGLAQSIFQLGGNAGTAVGPLLAAFIVVPRGQSSLALFAFVALVAMAVLVSVGRWYQRHLNAVRAKPRSVGPSQESLPTHRVVFAITILMLLLFSKYFYQVSLSNYYTFYLIEKFGVSVTTAQVYLFLFLGSIAVGTVAGGLIGDRIGFKAVIWGSILGTLPFTLILPYANLFWTGVLTVPIGLILASAFSAIMVYAQHLMPSRVGLVAGLFFGFAFGMAGIGAAVLGWLADQTSLGFVYRTCSFLPVVGLLTWFLPDVEQTQRRART